MPKLFRRQYGIIPSCDVDTLRSLTSLVKQTADLPYTVGYKVGIILALRYGLPRVVQAVRKHTLLPIIYDHQKYGGDIPDIAGGSAVSVIRRAGVDALIIFPHGGIQTLNAAVEGCQEAGLTPIVGGAMTHRGYTTDEGGYLADGSPTKIYLDAAETGLVSQFVVPGTKPDAVEAIVKQLRRVVTEPSLLFPGIGRGQGGDIVAAFEAGAGFPCYAIVGRGIFAQKNRRKAAESLWLEVAKGGFDR